MKNILVLLFFLIFNELCFGQQPFAGKCAPSVSLRAPGEEPEIFALVVADAPVFLAWADEQKIEIVREYRPANIVVLRTTGQELKAKILPRSDVIFVDRGGGVPQVELPVPGHNLFVNKINVIHNTFPDQNGAGIVVSIKENRFDTADVDFKNRAANSPNAAQQITSHANIVATLIGGAGNSDAAGRGVARGARLLSAGFNNLLPDDDADYAVAGVTVQNHSYGVDIENYYGAGALAYEQSVVQRPVLVHVFSAGNRGTEASASGIYAGIAGFANLTGNFKMAKNTLTVGAVDSFGQMTNFSSHGPAYDGRLKPDLVAFGQDGTSGAAALVSGTAAVLQQTFTTYNGGILPPAALIRAVLLNSADDVAESGPDFYSGYGNLNAKKAVETLVNQQYEWDGIGPGETWTFVLDVPPGMRRLKATLAWDDPPAAPNAAKALLNDLDLKIIAPDGAVRLPWVLSTFPHPDSLRLPATRRRDTLNNTEQVSLDFPQPGLYTIRVEGANMSTVNQPFSLAWSREEVDRFSWNFPVKSDPVTSGRDVLLRWENSFPDTNGQLEYRFSGTSDWQTIDPDTDLRTGLYRWHAPDTFSGAQVRMRIDGHLFETDTFLISGELRVKVGFNCPDSAMLFWNSAASEAIYLLSGLGERYLEPLKTTTDTFVVLQKTNFPHPRFSVTPMSEQKTPGQHSAAPDISGQGVECYFAGFLAELNAAFQAELNLQLGTLYGVQSVSFEKIVNKKVEPLKTWQPPPSAHLFFTDTFPQRGLNCYRARLELESGNALFSDTVKVYYLENREVLIFPNPVAGQNRITVVINTPEETSFVLYDILGRLIIEKTLYEFPEEITLPAGLPRGIYPYFLRENKRLKAGGKLMIGF